MAAKPQEDNKENGRLTPARDNENKKSGGFATNDI